LETRPTAQRVAGTRLGHSEEVRFSAKKKRSRLGGWQAGDGRDKSPPICCRVCTALRRAVRQHHCSTDASGCQLGLSGHGVSVGDPFVGVTTPACPRSRVMPAKAGIQSAHPSALLTPWTPAFAGVTTPACPRSRVTPTPEGGPSIARGRSRSRCPVSIRHNLAQGPSAFAKGLLCAIMRGSKVWAHWAIAPTWQEEARNREYDR
jgi:hypothetical protein